MNNNNNLYNILNNFNKLSESDTPKPAAESKPKTLLESTMEQVMQEKYMGFKKTVSALKKQGGIENPEALAASIGRKKYGKKAFQKAAAAGKKMGESAPHPKELEMDAKVRSMQIQNRADAVEKRNAEKAKEPQNVFQKVKKDIGEPLAKLAKGDVRGAFSEDDMEEGNEFSGELDAARKAGKTEFEVDGQRYPVKENGLQRYTGIKKYGKKGFEALQQAGREGADEEEKGRIKDRYIKKQVSEKAVSQQQQKFMGMVHAMQKGEKVKGASPELKKVAKGMTKKAAHDFAATKHKGLPKKVSENRDAYQRDYDSSVSGMDTDREFRNRERNAGLEDEKNNYVVYIDGQQWKVFADRRQAENIARSLTAKGKNAEVYVTGEDVSEGEEGHTPRLSIGQQMARDGITYSPNRENELIDLMA
jgi:hypothetical protein